MKIYRLLLMLLTLLSTTIAWSADGDSFTATTEDGVVLNFQVISEEAKTCKVSDNGDCVLPNNGVLIIPEVASGYTVVEIASYAFEFCDNIITLILPENLTTIGNNAFKSCTNLLSVTLSKNIVMTDIGGMVINPFHNCLSINEITIDCAHFGDWFSNIKSLKTVNIGSNVSTIGSEYYSPLAGCTGLETIIVDAANKTFDSRNNCNAIIETATNKLIQGCKNTIIPGTVTSINDKAFKDQSGLSEISIPAGVTSIGEDAFEGCTGLTIITSFILEPHDIYSSAFEDDTKSSATLRVPYVRSNSYKNLSCWGDFKTIVEMNGTAEEMTNIDFADPWAKKACVNEWDVNDDGEISIGEARLVTEIKGFGNLSELERFDEISYFTNVTTIGDAAFSDCKKLKEFIVPSKVTTIKRAAFAGCTSLASFVIPEGVTTISGQTFQSCSNLESVVIPSTLTDIGNYAFEGCKSLTSITLPEGLKSIGVNAFKSAGLLQITIPSTVTLIGNNAFSVDIIYCNLTAPISIDKIVFNPSDVILIVPAGSEEAFVNAAGWKDFMITSTSNDETIDWTKDQITVNIKKPGSLRLTIIELDDEEITRLKIKGSLNSEDIKYLVDSKTQGKLSKLESLDLSEVKLVYGGDAYASKIIVYDDIWPIRTDKTLFYLAETESIVGPEERVPGLGNYTDVTSFYGPDMAGAFAEGGYKHIVMPKSVTKAAKATFENCTNLQSVEFGGNLNSIDENAFKGCVSLKSFNLAGAESIGDEAFSGCTFLRTIDGLENVKQIGAAAFSGCKMITNVSLSENLTEIESEAFKGCKMLESISLPEGLKSISSRAFDGCTSLANVAFSPSLMQVDHSAFSNTAWLKALPTKNGVKYMGHIALCYDKESDYASTPSTTLSFKKGTTYIADGFIESIHNAHYQYVDHIIGIQFPSTLKKIGDEAFMSLPITSLTLPDGLEIIGKEAFASSMSLTKVTLPENLKQMGDRAFESCTSLNLVNYNIIKSNGEDLFSGCSAIEKVNIGSKVQLLPNGIFANCANLTIVKFAGRDDTTPFAIGDNAFYGCENLRNLELPAATNSIGKGAFEGCIGFTSFTVPRGVTKVSNRMLAGCSNITSIQLHDGIKNIGSDAFSNCSKVKSFKIPESVTSIGSYAFNGCYGLTELTIPAGVVKVGSAFLSDCYNLTKLVSNITKPKGVESVIPMSNQIVQDVYGHYYDWSAYTDIHYDKVRLFVPVGTKAAYAAATGWRRFKEIIEPKVSLSKTKADIEKGKTLTLKATVTLLDMTNISVTWSSSNTAVATVTSGGKVKGVKAGTATITCTSKATGLKATCKVTVGYVKLDKTEVNLEKDKTMTLTATVYPSSLSDKTVTWKSSDTKVATVSSAGKVKGVKAGTATITCTSKTTGLKTTCTVTVGYVKLDKTEAVIEKGKTLTLKATVYPSALTDKGVTWKSSDTKIATVSTSGKVKGVKAGTATITCTSKATGLTATCTVTVGYVKLGKTEATLLKGNTLTLKATVYPSSLSDKSVTWKSSNTKVATVTSAGKVKGVKAGTATITCTSKATGLKATCTVTVENGKVTLDKTEVRVQKGKTVTLKATVTPTSLTDKSVTWKSSNTKIATVTSAGKVKGIKAGTATITCTSNATGAKATCTVTVLQSMVSLPFNDDEMMEDEEMDNPGAEEPFDVYDLNGRMVKSQVTSLDGLPRGIYIINGKKVMK